MATERGRQPANCGVDRSKAGTVTGEPKWDELLQPIESTGVAEAVLRRLGELIGSGVLRPGERLPSEQELAHHFAVAPMTVRNALQAMRARGIVHTTRGRGAGTFVADDIRTRLLSEGAGLPTKSEFADFNMWREAISGESCALVATRITPDELTELRALAEYVDGEDCSPDDHRFADARLHSRIAELSGSPRLHAAELQIQEYLTQALAYNGPRTNPNRLEAQRHTRIVDAIAAGDAEGARAELKAHARATFDSMIGLGRIRPEPDAETSVANHTPMG